jgi:hypothetical protein
MNTPEVTRAKLFALTDERREPIQNTTRARGGQPWAWTLGQRYTRSDVLEHEPKTTDDLAVLEGRHSG